MRPTYKHQVPVKLQSLQNTSRLTVINVSNNNIGEEAADDIAAVLSHSTNLEKIDLGYNYLFRP